MLRITRDSELSPTILRLEGKLIGPWVKELEVTWVNARKSDPAKSVVVDLTEITFIDAEGKELLKSMFGQGANLRSSSLMTQFIIDQIRKES